MLKRSLIYLLVAIAFISVSCEDEDKFPVQTSSITGGAVLTTVDVSGETLNVFNPSASDLAVTLQFNDFNDNDSMESVDLFLEFIDTTPVNNQVINLDEVQIASLTLADFSDVVDGFPTNTFELNGQDALDALGLTNDQLDGGDLFLLRYALNLNDGTTFTNTNVGNNVATTSHNTPFRYSTEVFCPIEDPTFAVGTYNLEVVSGLFPDFGVTLDWSEVEVEIISTGQNSRQIVEACFIPSEGSFCGPIDFSFVCDNIEVLEQPLGGGESVCDGTVIGFTEDGVSGVYDLSDDNTFTLSFVVDAGSGTCPSTSYESTIRLTRI